MKPRIIKGEDLEEDDYGDTKVTNILNTEEYPDFSIVKVRKTGHNVKIGKDTESDVAFYVLEGEGTCTIEDEKHEVKKGDLIFVSKGTRYKNTGDLVLLAVASPRFDRDKRIRED